MSSAAEIGLYISIFIPLVILCMLTVRPVLSKICKIVAMRLK